MAGVASVHAVEVPVTSPVALLAFFAVIVVPVTERERGRRGSEGGSEDLGDTDHVQSVAERAVLTRGVGDPVVIFVAEYHLVQRVVAGSVTGGTPVAVVALSLAELRRWRERGGRGWRGRQEGRSRVGDGECNCRVISPFPRLRRLARVLMPEASGHGSRG